jgi:CRISPR-associated protein Csx17
VAVGYGSATASEETTDGSRAELWLPLWEQPATLAEVRHVFAEGRAQLGRRQARNAVEFALAVNLLGVSRGVTAFTRYGFLKRNGLAFLAAPLGRVAVSPRPMARLLDDPTLTEWLDRLRAACRDKDKTPARYQAALRQIDRAMFEFANRSEQGEAADRQALLAVLAGVGRAERTLAGGLAFCKDKYIRPLQGLFPQWREQADDWSPEFRLAAAVTGIAAEKDVGPFRVYLEPVEAIGTGFRWDDGSVSAVWSNRSLAANLAAVFRRRLLEAFRAGLNRVPLTSPHSARLADVAAFLREETDDEKLTELLWALSAVSWSGTAELESGRAEDEVEDIPLEYGIPRLLVEPLPLVAVRSRWRFGETGEPTVPDPDVFHILASGQRDAVGQSVDRAARRLKSGGRLVTGYRNRRQAGKPLAIVSAVPADRLLAAMLFPLSRPDLERIANAVLYPPEAEE